MVKREGLELGQSLNLCKSEIVCNDLILRDKTLILPGCRVVGVDEAELLGAPIGNNHSISRMLQSKIDLLEVLVGRLELFHSQDALLLLRHAFSVPKLLYTLRTAPCFQSGLLEDIDALLCKALGSITNIHLVHGSVSWSQATLPIKFGGLGIRSLQSLAPSAYLSSLCSCADLMSVILLPQYVVTDRLYDFALPYWKEGIEDPPPPSDVSHLQRAWDFPHIVNVYHSLLDEASEKDRARILASSSKESGAWLNATPLSSLGLMMRSVLLSVCVWESLSVSLVGVAVVVRRSIVLGPMDYPVVLERVGFLDITLLMMWLSECWIV